MSATPEGSARPAFDPRTELRAELHDLGPIRVFRPDANGVLTERQERQRAMSVYLDGQERIERGLVVTGGDPLVACRPCPSCDLFECNLTEDYAARVRRFGPYVLWITVWGEQRCFSLDRYREVFGGDVEALVAPTVDDYLELDEPARSGAWRCPDGRALVLDLERAPDEPLAKLSVWRGDPAGDLVAVAPPGRAIELPSAGGGAPSLWIEAHPRPDGRRAAFLPGVFILPVWLVGPEVDQVAAAALGAEAQAGSPASGVGPAEAAGMEGQGPGLVT